MKGKIIAASKMFENYFSKEGEGRVAKIFAIANQKGGVGKTTTAVNLSASLGDLGKKVLLVDCDPQGNASSGLGINKLELQHTIYDVLINNFSAADTMVETPYKVSVLPANMELAGAEVELVSMEERENKMRQALDKIRDDFDFILIDCPPSLGLLTVNALTAADAVIIPIQCEFYALEGVTQLLNTIEIVRNQLNPLLSIDGFIMTMFDSRTRLSKQVVEEVFDNFGGLLYDTLIQRSVKLSEAPSYGQPIVAYDRFSKSAEMYLNLAREVVERGK